MSDKQKVLYSSDEAATKQTVTGWVSRTGRFWGDDEHIARWDGCTHKDCRDCGQPVEKTWLICDACREKSRIAKFEKKEKKVWDGDGMVYSDSLDKYFTLEDLIDYCEEEGVNADDLQLLICEPNYPRPIDTDHFCDELPEDGDLPSQIYEAMDAFNAVLAKQPPLSYSPGKYAAIIKNTKHIPVSSDIKEPA